MRPLAWILGIALMLTSLVSVWAFQQAGAQEKLAVLIVTGHDVKAHPWRDTSPLTRQVLEETGRFDVRIAEDINILESSRLNQYDAIVLNFGHWTTPELTDEARQNLIQYVEQGGGLVALHFACSSFQEWAEYEQLLGRVWKQGVGGHGPRGVFTVKIDDQNHPITQGLSDFEIDDELYAKLTGDEDIQVLASAYSDWSGKVEPLVFTLQRGEGRVVQNVLGHDMKARQNPNYLELLRRGVEWAATGNVRSG